MSMSNTKKISYSIFHIIFYLTSVYVFLSLSFAKGQCLNEYIKSKSGTTESKLDIQMQTYRLFQYIKFLILYFFSNFIYLLNSICKHLICCLISFSFKHHQPVFGYRDWSWRSIYTKTKVNSLVGFFSITVVFTINDKLTILNIEV